MAKKDNDARYSTPDSHRQIRTSVHDVGSEISLTSMEFPPPSGRASTQSRQSHHSDHQLPRTRTYHPFAPHVLLLLIPSSIFGLLARLGLVALGTYEGQSIFPLAYAQGLGCFVMGYFVFLKEPMGKLQVIPVLYPPLYTALTTGFCGSLTTFSSWQLDVFNSWLNPQDAHRPGLRDFMDGLGKTVFTLAISLASVLFGGYMARVSGHYLPSLPPPSHTVRYALTIACVLFYAATLPTYFLLPNSFRHRVTAALLFAFPGTLVRYILSVYLNPIMASFPLGTFAANFLGTGLLAAFHVIQSIANKPVSPNACSLLQGLVDGFCGCLTTVSTFAVEIRALQGWERPRYVVMSWGAGQILFLLVMGPSLLAGNKKIMTCSFN
ncbi:hypothetical protein D9757_002739 [Collybiopsis confluens]|uniref:CrcB-like protein n=1 Tax=Collybiopsis confluens TaxID=2823264 RepID=A0A8H5MEC6_9AGAR|nr:hypothetical protein D9757_002739 [Collybiopsis confluens]